jgi:hypothetical protein
VHLVRAETAAVRRQVRLAVHQLRQRVPLAAQAAQAQAVRAVQLVL